MERLWSPWRLKYVTSTKSDTGCVFCLPVAAGDAPRSGAEGSASARHLESDSLVVFHGSTAYVVLNLYPYNNGHLMVVPYRHVSSLSALRQEELQEVAILTQRAEAVLLEAYNPGGINVGINLGKPAGAGIHEHLHVHLVPRWNGDSNFMTVVGDTRVLPEELGVTVERLRPLFEKHGK